jgi:pyruvate formate lyase activating enzyme
MKLKIIQKGFNYSQDGPGNRLVYHLQGCNMHCPWCANPESMELSGTKMIVDGKEKLSCREYEIEELLDEADRSSMMFFESGGVTLTGGEPTVQFEGTRELLMKLKERGIHTAIENNGTHPRLFELLPYVDYLIMDFKHPDSNKLKAVTGASNEKIKENLMGIFKSSRQIAVRIPLIGGFNTSKEDLNGFLSFFKAFETDNATFEMLRYHEFGRDKWKQCGKEYKMDNAFVDVETLKLFEDTFRANGLHIIRT